MGDKKGKALAMELIDDLLNDQGTKAIDDGKAEATRHVNQIKKPASAEPQPSSAVEDDKTVDLEHADSSNSLNELLPPVPGMTVDPNDPDGTVAVHGSQHVSVSESETPATPRSIPSDNADRVRASVGRYGALRSTGAPTVTEAALAQSESLRIAQNRILELEQEIERLRTQNEELGAAGETLRRRTDELRSDNQKRENDYQYAVSTFEQEKGILQSTKEALQRDLENLRRKNDELELRISTNIQKIRVRERELENRLELVKMEGAALIRSKDEMILELKRQIDQLNLELNNFRTKNQELNRVATDKQEMLRRTVKALRLALSMLEGEEEPRAHPNPSRKVK